MRWYRVVLLGILVAWNICVYGSTDAQRKLSETGTAGRQAVLSDLCIDLLDEMKQSEDNVMSSVQDAFVIIPVRNPSQLVLSRSVSMFGLELADRRFPTLFFA